MHTTTKLSGTTLITALTACLVLLLFAGTALAGSATLSWDAPTSNIDGTPLTDIAGYRVHYGTQPGVHAATVDVGNTVTATISGLTDGQTYYFSVSAYDTTGNESSDSNEVSKTITAVSYSLSVSRAGTGSGTVSSSPAGLSCGTICSASFTSGSAVVLTAAADAGSFFAGWSGDCSGSQAQSTVTMSAARACTATFTAKAATTTTLTSSRNPSVLNKTITLTAAVTSSGAAPSGTVTFRDGGTEIAGCTNLALANGSVSCPAAAFTADTHTLTALYQGDGMTNASTSAALAQIVISRQDSIGLFNDGTWYLDLNKNGAWDGTAVDGIFSFGTGLSEAVAVAGDWAGDGISRVGIFRSGTWYLDMNNSGSWDGSTTDAARTFGAGLAGAVPMVGDWNGDGTSKLGIFANGEWFLDANGNGAWDGEPADVRCTFGAGLAGAVPVVGDWTGDGIAKVGIFVNGYWYLDLNGNCTWDGATTDKIAFFGAGLANALPAVGDWTGSGTSKLGVYANGTWYLDKSGSDSWDGSSTDGLYQFGGGLANARPAVGAW